jgi:phosphatidylserine/phosphatidylglycerophosphate/cardiolipin synthase-like enzyme
MLKTSGIMHTKLWIIDGNTTFVGSHNISGRSLNVNEEVSVKIESKEVAYFAQQYFENLIKS